MGDEDHRCAWRERVESLEGELSALTLFHRRSATVFHRHELSVSRIGRSGEQCWKGGADREASLRWGQRGLRLQERDLAVVVGRLEAAQERAQPGDGG